jgi:imidazole glycerol-phosphate synthase subunit HisH
MRNLRDRSLVELIKRKAEEGTPILGICLGMQLLFEQSEELNELTPGLGLLGGNVTRLQADGLRIPHIGWNEVRFERPTPLTAELAQAGRPFYHVHSFAPRPADSAEIVGTTEYGERFATFVSKRNVHGVQFHPEKSSRDGLTLLGNFVGVCATALARA